MSTTGHAWIGRVVAAAFGVASAGSIIATLVLLNEHSTITPYAAAGALQDACALVALGCLAVVVRTRRSMSSALIAWTCVATLVVAVSYVVTLSN